ncbi:carboxylesterase family protein [Streptomyces sp. ISL-44]|uniref:carboxylesterase family protein n=1 Tax=Streptomyces sp. ISL-44 TaxID=2819184 RepID=UPI002035AAC7|nr:carboxylesterase family protein [Streptomyces sp. ISL-44]
MGSAQGRTAPVVNTRSGPVRGVVEDDLVVFKGVPYAAPPVGPLRWRPAQPHQGWSGTLDATQWGHWTAPFMPVLDGSTAPRQPALNLLDGPGADIDVLIGWTSEESAFTFALGETYASATRERVLRRARDSFGDGAAEAYAAYEAARAHGRSTYSST